jgi:hypothetical protein
VTIEIDPVELTRDLIRCPSITPADAGALDVLQGSLERLGFACHRLMFSAPDTPDIDNLMPASAATAAPTSASPATPMSFRSATRRHGRPIRSAASCAMASSSAVAPPI